MFERRSLVERLTRQQPQLILMYAPTGYGKTALAQRLAARHARRAIVTCSESGGIVAAAGLVLDALGDESPERRRGLARLRRDLVSAAATETEWMDAVEREWTTPVADSFFTFDHAERLLRVSGAVPFLAQLLRRPVAGRAVCICAHHPLPLDAHQATAIATIDERDLRLSRRDVQQLLANAQLPREDVERIWQCAAGWPIAVELLSAFARTSPARNPAREPGDPLAELRVEVVAETVHAAGQPVRLTDREFELAMALATANIHREALETLMWPDAAAATARNNLKVYVNRLRSKFGRSHAIAAGDAGYRLGPMVGVDLAQIDATLEELRHVRRIGDADRATLQAYCTALQRVQWSRTRRFTWFVAVRERVADLTHEIAGRLANDAAERRDGEATLRYARILVGLDPCDETARELTIRALLDAGERRMATLEYQNYRRILRRELDAEPSPELHQLANGS